jgi:hypothetical protein
MAVRPDVFRFCGDAVRSRLSVSTVSRLYVVHSETRKQKRVQQKKKARVTARKRDEARGISVISLSEVYPAPERCRVSASVLSHPRTLPPLTNSEASES